ncbi:MAG: hypothetical protein RMK84_05440 [Oscillochloridaceae bacterium]|nr:hypothetical protein [Chloroflexaceae bacterium]MDW8389547.1 hypothetical protein [Oscillochloridaceae bacterium]
MLLAALADHVRVCEAVDRFQHSEVVTYHEVALPPGTGEEEEWGKGETASVTRFRSMHPATITAEHLRGVWRPDAVHAAALRDREGIQLWAQEYAA